MVDLLGSPVSLREASLDTACDCHSTLLPRHLGCSVCGDQGGMMGGVSGLGGGGVRSDVAEGVGCGWDGEWDWGLWDDVCVSRFRVMRFVWDSSLSSDELVWDDDLFRLKKFEVVIGLIACKDVGCLLGFCSQIMVLLLLRGYEICGMV
ncbi:hypothetical protein Tco_0815483 [Tanacetum coccineum]